MTSRLVLLRHGRTSWNAVQRFQGQTEVDLDDVGLDQGHDAAQALREAGITAVVTSDLSRARDTAQVLATALALPLAVDARLREVHLGSWQGLDAAAARQAHPEEHDAWRQGVDVRRGGGETYAEVAERALPAVREAMTGIGDGGALAVVSHGGTIRAVIASLLGLPHDAWSGIGPVGNGCWSTLAHLPTPDGVGRWRLLQHNVSPATGGGAP